jgi:opacity protein-like surface antigen
MKKTFTFLSAAALLAISFTAAQAFPTGKSNESGDYLNGTGLSHLLSGGIYGGSLERDVEYGDASTVLPLESSKAVIYLGLNLRPWLTLFAGVGGADHDLGMAESDTTHVIEAGLLINVIDHDILDSSLFEDRLRINMGATWAATEAEWYGEDVKWQEINAFATISIVNDTTGNKLFNPNSIAIYAGPVYSHIVSDDLEADQELGFMAGIEVFVSESITLDLGVRQFDSTGFEGGLNIQF